MYDSSICDPPCQNGGLCLDNVCHCSDSYAGNTCEDRTCSKECLKNDGVCDTETGDCLCPYEKWGDNCEYEACPGAPDPSPLKYSVTFNNGKVQVTHNDNAMDRKGGWLPQGVSLQASLMCSGRYMFTENEEMYVY